MQEPVLISFNSSSIRHCFCTSFIDKEDRITRPLPPLPVPHLIHPPVPLRATESSTDNYRPSPEETRLFLQGKEQVPEARGAKHIDITMKLHHNKAQS